MAKFAKIIVGGLALIGVAIAIVATGGFAAVAAIPLLASILGGLATAGAGMLLTGAGTLLSSAQSGGGPGGGSSGGISVASRNPIKAWDVCYGQCCVGGTMVFINEFGDTDKYLDIIIVLAAHRIQSVDWLLFDKQKVQLSRNPPGSPQGPGGPFVTIGNSFSPVQQVIDIARVHRVDGVVTLTTAVSGGDIPLLGDGDKVFIENTTDLTMSGTYPVFNCVHYPATPSYMTFQYLSGGLGYDYADGHGKVHTRWPDYGNNIYMEVLLGDQIDTFQGMLNGTPNGGDLNDLIYNTGSNPWGAAHLLKGKACVMLRLTYDQKAFSGGLPSVSFVLHGKNDILDPSDGTRKYTENAALCIADYLMDTTWGFAAAYPSEVPSAPLLAAASACNEMVPLASGQSEKRFTCNGHFDLTLGRGRILQNLLTSCAGKLTYSAGQWVIWPGVWRGSTPYPAPTLGQMAGPLHWKPTVSLRDLYNGVKGLYVSPFNNWQASDIPPYAQDSTHGYTVGQKWSSSIAFQEGDQTVYNDIGYIALAGNFNKPPDVNPTIWGVHYQDINMSQDLNVRRWLDVQLPFTITASMAQRICKIELLRRRQFGSGTLVFNLAGYGMAVMDVIQVNIPFFMWVNKLLEVIALRFTLTEQTVAGGNTPTTLLGVEVDVQETDPSVYDWNPSEELTPQGYQQSVLPSIYTPAPPTDLTLESDYSTAVIVNGAIQDTILVSWTAPADGYVTEGGHIEVQFHQYYPSVIQGTISIGTDGQVTFSDPVLTYAHISGALLDTTSSPPLVFTITSVTSALRGTVTPAPATAIVNATFILDAVPPWTGLPSVDPTVTQVVIHGVIDGVQYVVQIRSVNAAGVSSDWVEAGPITASGAHAPWCLIPGAQADVGRGGYTLGLKQKISGSDLLLDVISTTPVNSFSPTLTIGPDTSAATETVTGGGGLADGDYAAVLYAVDANGLYSPPSDIAFFSVQGGGGKFTWTGIIWDPTAAGYNVFVGPDIYHMGSDNAATMGAPPANISISGSTGAASLCGAPDIKFDHFRLRMRWASHLGVAGLSVGLDPTYTNIPVDTTTMDPNEFINRRLFHIGTANLDMSQAIAYASVLSNDNKSFTVTSPEGIAFDLDDTLVVLAQANIASSTTIGDTLFVNTQNPDGVVGLGPTDDLVGYHVVIWEGRGAGQERNVIGNTQDTVTVDVPWDTVPDSSSYFFIIASTYVYDLPTTPLVNSDLTGTNVIGTIPITSYQNQQMFIEIATVDANGNFIHEGAPTRPCWIFAGPASPGGDGSGDTGAANF